MLLAAEREGAASNAPAPSSSSVGEGAAAPSAPPSLIKVSKVPKDKDYTKRLEVGDGNEHLLFLKRNFMSRLVK